MNNLYGGVCLTPEEGRKIDAFLLERLTHSQEADHAAIQRLRDGLAPTYEPALCYDVDRYTPSWYEPGWVEAA